MSLTPSLTSPEKQVIDANDRYLQNYSQRAADAYNYISNYTFPGGSAMVSHTWNAPTGNIFYLDMGAGNIQMDSTPFSSLGTAQKVIFFRYLQKFIGQCLKNYNINYGL